MIRESLPSVMSDELFVREAPLLVVRRAMSPPSAVTPGVEGVHERSSHVVFDPKDAEASIWALEVPLTKFSSAKRTRGRWGGFIDFLGGSG